MMKVEIKKSRVYGEVVSNSAASSHKKLLFEPQGGEFNFLGVTSEEL